LKALLPARPDAPQIDWPLFTRAGLAWKAGYTGTSGSITRVLNGLREGSSSGKAHPGLIALGLVEEVRLDIVGLIEVNYRITAAGVAAYQQHVAAHGEELPPVKDAALCTDDRYLTQAVAPGGEEGGGRSADPERGVTRCRCQPPR
jgi:hypothetical protein